MPVHIYFLIHTFWYKLVAKLRKFPARALPCQPCAAWAGHKLVHCLSITLTVTQSQSCNIVTVVTSGPAGHWFRFDMNFSESCSSAAEVAFSCFQFPLSSTRMA